MNRENTNGWSFTELSEEEGLDINEIFGAPVQAEENPFGEEEVVSSAAAEMEPDATQQEAVQPDAAQQHDKHTQPTTPEATASEEKPTEQKQMGLLEKLPIFYHKGAKEPIEDPGITFEELRIRKAEDFPDLEEGKYVSWTMEYCSIRKEIKDPKGTTVIAMKETIERSREFLDALKKAKDKNPDCFVKPKVVMKTKGVAGYRGSFPSVEEARASDKVICLIPAEDGKFYELQKTPLGEFIAPKTKVREFAPVRAGFTPALPKIPLSLMRKILAFFRSFMKEHEEYEALVLIYWDTVKEEFLAYVPKQTVYKAHIDADLTECPYDDPRYLHYMDIHSHNSMEAFFSAVDDTDERGTGLYGVVGNLDQYYPTMQVRISCGGSFVDIDPGEVMETLDEPFPEVWKEQVVCHRKKGMSKETFLKTILSEV